ncbi:MAG: SUF system Fe-S cluster assembly protein [Candidatus Thiodiazotropha sp. (ex Monitilora ramsayi)]|nr:SUF system Fe-S cluster assembly protein [Candidatus Thiodiazotropha sp. (ex Monitilora ramsayi)]
MMMLNQTQIIEALRTVYDPEIPVNIYDLGLIYRIEVDESGVVEVDMTLTAPACPVAGTLPHEVGRVIDGVPGVTDATVRLVWEPPWTQERMSEEALLQLGML